MRARPDEEFEENLRSLTAMVSAARLRLHAPQLKEVIVGSRSDRANIHGMLFVDVIRDSELVFTDRGERVRIPVDSLWRVGDCWKLESIGYSAMKEGMRSERPNHEKRNKPEESSRRGFRRVTQRDFCTALIIYDSPEPGNPIGSLIEGYRKYKDDRHSSPTYAVMVKTYINDEIRARWMTPEQLSRSYLRTDDPALSHCSWSERDQEVRPLADEIPIDNGS